MEAAMIFERVLRNVLLTAAGCCLMGSAALGIDLASLSDGDASAGLRKALDQGVGRAVDRLGVTDGFLKNPAVKIPLPPKLEKAQGLLRMVGMGDQVDQLVTTMNRAAEAAVPGCRPLFTQALTKMKISDAKRILTGADDAATQYFKAATEAPLTAKFRPVIAQETQKLKLADSYDAIAKKGVALGLLQPDEASLEAYVTQKTLDGLFLMIAQEERAIRKDPLGQASSLLKKVFGAIH
jgi:hypothetical protein